MAYFQHYNITAKNPLGETLEVIFYKKDEVAAEIVTLKSKSILVEYREGSESKYDWLLSCNATIIIRVSHDTPIDNETFLSDFYDEWKVEIKDDDQLVFTGFIEPSQGGYAYKGKPYDIEVRATDGLKLLSETPLTDTSGDNFAGLHELIEIVAGALVKTGLELPIRLYCNMYEVSMETRSTDIDKDMFNQARLDYRTFIKAPGVFMSCLEALELILKEGFKIVQWHGKWVIFSIPEQQFSVGPEWYYTDYAFNGISPVGALEESTQCNIGKDMAITPIDISGLISWDFPVQSVKHTYTFEVVRELMNNDNLTKLGDFIAPLSGSGYSAWELVKWSTWQNDPASLAVYAGTKNAYIKTEYDAYTVEQERFFVLEYDAAAPGDLKFVIRHDDQNFYVKEGDKISVSGSARTKLVNTGLSSAAFMRVLIYMGTNPSVATNYMSMDADGNWQNDDQAIFAFTYEGSTSQKWRDTSVTDIVLPAGGVLLVYLGMGNHTFTGTGQEVHIKYPTITYKPYLVGSNESVKGDSWTTSQDLNVKGAVVESLGISDAPRPILKGALIRGATVDDENTRPQWGYGDGAKTSHYKELINYARYNLSKRRYKKFNVTCKGVKMIADNEIAGSNYLPIGFHKQFSLTEDDNTSRMYVPVPPLSINYSMGRFTGTLAEVMKDGDDFDDNADNHFHNYDF